MKKVLLYISTAITCSFLFVSCEKESPLGPNIEDLYGSFRIFDSLSSPANVNFETTEDIRFTGSWSNAASWKITITGKTSGSVKTIEGKSKTLDTTIAAWNGTADGLFFKKEVCDIQLTFADYADTMNSTITIDELHNYTNDGILLQSFEGTSTIEFWGGSGLQSKKTNMLDAPEGKNYYYMEGKENGGAYWLGSFTPFNASTITGLTHYPFNDTDTATTYLNFFVRGYGYADTFVNFEIKEDDNGDGTYSDTEDSFSYRYQVPSSNTGWQKVSIPLSKLITEGNATGNGNLEISKISTIYIMLFSAGIAQPKTACDIDFLILTQGKPL